MTLAAEVAALVGPLPGPALRERLRRFMVAPGGVLDLAWAEIKDDVALRAIFESTEVLAQDGEAGLKLTRRTEDGEKRTEDNRK